LRSLLSDTQPAFVNAPRRTSARLIPAVTPVAAKVAVWCLGNHDKVVTTHREVPAQELAAGCFNPTPDRLDSCWPLLDVPDPLLSAVPQNDIGLHFYLHFF
jgi:hypothetical protein